MFSLYFKDTENDRIDIKIVENNFIRFFVQSISNSTTKYNIILEAMYASNVPVDLVVKYTDVYHQDPSDTMNITFTLNLFSIEPPVFQEQLSPLNANTWADFYITLPNIVDPNGLRWGVSLDQSAQSWVIYNQNNSLTLLTSRLSLNTSEVMNIRIRITNEDNAWTEYNQTVTVDPLISPVFGTINNLTVSANTVTEFDYVFTGSSAVTAVDWQTNATISWVSLNRASNKLIKQNFVQLKL